MAWQNSAGMGANGGASGGGGDGGNNGGQQQGTEYTLQGGENAPALFLPGHHAVEPRHRGSLVC